MYQNGFVDVKIGEYVIQYWDDDDVVVYIQEIGDNVSYKVCCQESFS